MEKNNYIQYKDNFLEKNDFEYLEKEILDAFFPWYFNNSRTYSYDNNYQFTHTFFKDGQVKSNYMKILDAFLKKLNPKALVRIKANLTLSTNSIDTGLFHVDQTFKCKTGIFYLNNNNGKTLFKNFEISSIKNRFVSFPTDFEHAGTSHTDEKRRVVLNVNYF